MSGTASPGPSLGSHAHTDRSRVSAAWQDVVEGVLHWPQWFTLGNLDIRLRFRRTGLGPFWSTLSFTLLAVALGLVYAKVLGEASRSYLPYVVVGLFVWTFAATVLQEACDSYVHAEHALKQVYFPRSTILYRLLWRNLALLGFNLATVIIVLIVCRVNITASLLLAPAGLALLVLNLAWMSLILALAAARFRAVARLVHTLMPITMLVSPIIWRPGAALRPLARWNPVYHAVQLVRGPILGDPPPAGAWLGAAALAAAGFLVAFAIFARARSRLPYWL
jgi:lipopolysaccharide transport system permease protein